MKTKRAKTADVIRAVRRACGAPCDGRGLFSVTVEWGTGRRWGMFFSDVPQSERNARASARVIVKLLAKLTADPTIIVRVSEDTSRYGDECDRDVLALTLPRAA